MCVLQAFDIGQKSSKRRLTLPCNCSSCHDMAWAWRLGNKQAIVQKSLLVSLNFEFFCNSWAWDQCGLGKSLCHKSNEFWRLQFYWFLLLVLTLKNPKFIESVIFKIKSVLKDFSKYASLCHCTLQTLPINLPSL